MYKNGFGLNKLQCLMCYKTKPSQTIAVGDEVVHTFPKGIGSKVNVIISLEFDLAFYDFAIDYNMGYLPG